ncbi:hypothetical protein JAAARDRAFT_175911 [Jaapia argillacea MUCL 33604]|uniref:Uncharacterized protein n=1 Tax=Jaapia argillacea MUCL 33604 TaxID=933084 RepID=A0A067PWF7_9AGAM|nr:hypothetical protein JAAARDRAFT_175911 [Jaapia argillacea MUCL 33604]
MALSTGPSQSENQFTELGSDVLLRTPGASSSTSPGNPKHPRLVLIFGWMGAQLPHLHKYSQAYSKLYPDATQVLVRCERSVFSRTEVAKQESMIPVAEVLEDLGYIPSSVRTKPDPATPDVDEAGNRSVLVHAFSNGGGYQLSTLSRVLAKRKIERLSPIANALILDSCPGSGGVSTSVTAFTSHIRNPFIRYPSAILVWLFFSSSHLLAIILRRKPWVDALKETLNKPDLLPWMDKNTPRLYIYSKTDHLIPWKQIEAHAKEGEEKGFDVRSEVFEKSDHVAHARTDPKRYWGAVEDVWNAAVKLGDIYKAQRFLDIFWI